MASSIDTVRKAFRGNSGPYRLHTTWLTPASAAQLARNIGSYNKFDGEVTAKALQRIGELDPNARFSVGRESSPVVYVETRKPGVSIGVFGNVTRNHRPDEVDRGPFRGPTSTEHPGKRSGHSVVRAWWD